LTFNVGDLNDLLVDGEIKLLEKKRVKKGKRKEARKKR
jgi:hypothetical protein